MSKDQAGNELKEGDRVTLAGVVVHVSGSDVAPCQVLLDVPQGDASPTVTLESRLLRKDQAAPQSAPQVVNRPEATKEPAAPPKKS